MNRIVALHGFLGQGSDWDPVFLNLQDYGVSFQRFSPSLFAPYTTWLQGDDFHDWAKRFLANNNVETFVRRTEPSQKNILVGYSFGGRLAHHLALEAPSLWDSIILVATHPGLFDKQQKVERGRHDQKWADHLINAKWDEFIHAWNSQPVFEGSTERRRLARDFDRELLERALRVFSLSQMAVDETGLKRLERCRWVVGERDTKFLQLMTDLQLQKLIDDVDIVPEAGHRVLFDRPRAIAEILVAGLKV